jgi:hypothetical protein
MTLEQTSSIYLKLESLKPLVEQIAGKSKGTTKFSGKEWEGFFLDGPHLTAPDIGLDVELDAAPTRTMNVFMEANGGYVPRVDIALDGGTARTRVFRLREYLPEGQISQKRGFGWKLNPATPIRPS